MTKNPFFHSTVSQRSELKEAFMILVVSKHRSGMWPCGLCSSMFSKLMFSLVMGIFKWRQDARCRPHPSEPRWCRRSQGWIPAELQLLIRSRVTQVWCQGRAIRIAMEKTERVFDVKVGPFEFQWKRNWESVSQILLACLPICLNDWFKKFKLNISGKNYRDGFTEAWREAGDVHRWEYGHCRGILFIYSFIYSLNLQSPLHLIHFQTGNGLKGRGFIEAEYRIAPYWWWQIWIVKRYHV